MVKQEKEDKDATIQTNYSGLKELVDNLNRGHLLVVDFDRSKRVFHGLKEDVHGGI